MTDFRGTDMERPGNEMETMDLSCREDTPQAEGVNLQCINSSDFVIGRLMTFNGPVTIINSLDNLENCGIKPSSPSKEEIVIREKIISPVTQPKTPDEKDTEKVTEGKREKVARALEKLFCYRILKAPLSIWLLLIAVVLVSSLVFFLGNDVSGSVGETSAETINYNGTEYNFYTRKAWGARTPLLQLKLKTPVDYIVISHTAGRFCYLKNDCMSLVRDIQADHMSLTPPLVDIAYSFLVGGDGNIYEGRGWTTRTASGGFANGRSININFIGSFENLDQPTYPQTEAVKALIGYGVNNTYIAKDYSLVAANSTYPTLSPGKQVYKEIKTWPHFDPHPELHLKE